MSHDSCVVSLSFSDRIFDSLFNFEVHSSKPYVFGRSRQRDERRTQTATAEHGGVAHLGEHLPCKQGVRGSIPLISTTVHRTEDR